MTNSVTSHRQCYPEKSHAHPNGFMKTDHHHPMKTYISLILSIFFFVVFSPLLYSATIVSYDFATSANPTTQLANTTSTAVTSTSVQWTGSTNNGWSGSSFSFFGRGPKDTNLTSYIQFTVSAAPTYTLDLSGFSFNYHMSQIQSANANFSFEVRSSSDNYASAIAGTYSVNPVTNATAGATYRTASFDLTGGSFDDLEDITFRLYVTGNVTPNTNDIARWDDIVLTGDITVIPEPASALLCSLGLLGLLRRRRA